MEGVAQTANSRFHMDVSEHLRRLRVAHDYEFVTEDGLFSIDIATCGPRGQVAIEVDGPYHFTVNTQQPLGNTLIRHARSLGLWRVRKGVEPGMSCCPGISALRGAVRVGEGHARNGRAPTCADRDVLQALLALDRMGVCCAER